MQKDLPARKNLRLSGYDYGNNGAYFITVCVKDRHELLGHIYVGAAIGRPLETELSDIGRIVDLAVKNIGTVYESVNVEKYVIMPNHIHMILFISGNGRAMRAPTISTIINQFKGYASKQIGFSFWQKSFHDHIIRNEVEYMQIWQYIDENPARWPEDCYYTATDRRT